MVARFRRPGCRRSCSRLVCATVFSGRRCFKHTPEQEQVEVREKEVKMVLELMMVLELKMVFRLAHNRPTGRDAAILREIERKTAWYVMPLQPSPREHYAEYDDGAEMYHLWSVMAQVQSWSSTCRLKGDKQWKPNATPRHRHAGSSSAVLDCKHV